jgi:hypothetical protein
VSVFRQLFVEYTQLNRLLQELGINSSLWGKHLMLSFSFYSMKGFRKVAVANVGGDIYTYLKPSIRYIQSSIIIISWLKLHLFQESWLVIPKLL